MNQSVAQILSSLIEARQNCRKTSNTVWFERHGERAKRVSYNYLPSGSGIDCGTQLNIDRSTGDKLVFDTAYHHTDGNGSYAGWTEHTVTVRPAFDGFDIRISGRDRNEIKDYLHECFDMALRQVLTDDDKGIVFAEPLS